jgi:NADH-quinone oxidoreductase subunit C
MNIGQIVSALRDTFPAETIEVRTVPIRESVIALPPDCVHSTVRELIERFDLRHLSAITGQDTGDEIELLYHFWSGQGLTLRTALPRERPEIASLMDLIPGAAFYEREVSEMLGVAFDGHPDLRPLLLPEDWDDEPPLRQHHSPPSPEGGDGERGMEEGGAQ